MSGLLTADSPIHERTSPNALSIDPERAAHGLFTRGFISRDRWDGCLDIRMQLAVFVPMPRISLQTLLGLRAGMVLEAGWPATQDVPVLIEDRFLANGELEPLGDRLGVRINSFTEQARPNLAAGSSSRAAAAGSTANPDSDVSDAELQRVCSLEDLKLSPLLRFGETSIPMRDVLSLCVGDIVALDRRVSAPVSLAAGGRVVAQGDLVMLGGSYAIRITSVAELRRHLPPYDAPF